MMRILIASAHRNLIGGVEKYLQALIPGLLDRGHDVGFLYEYPADPAKEQVHPPATPLRTWCVAELGVPAVLNSVAQWRPDIVYCHGLDGAESVSLESALLDRYPGVLYVHNYDRTCATGRKCFSFPKIQACTRQLGPACLLLHYPRRCGGLHPGTMWRRYQRHTQLNSRLPDHRAILVASSHMHAELQRNGAKPETLHLVPLPTTDVVPQPTLPRPKSFTGRILFVGRLTDVKGADHLIQAIPKAAEKLGRPLTLTIAGDGAEGPKLREMSARLGVAVEFAGWVQTPEKLNLMRQSDLLAVPSLWPEPFGLVGIEAGCVGLPAAAYAIGGIQDWLLPGETGESAPSDPPTVEGLAEAIVRALASPEHYARLCRGAWQFAQRFSLENHLAQLEPILGVESSLQPTPRPTSVAMHHE
jgi:glycosyltransferase involved in cell wall biosynthesis